MWPKYWSFSISSSNEYLGLISFRDWLVWTSCCPRDSQESFPAPQFESINSSKLSLLYDPNLTSVHDSWKNHSSDYTDLCRQSDISAFQCAVEVCLVASLLAQTVRNLPAMQETQVWSLSQEDALEKGMATHSRILLPGEFHAFHTGRAGGIHKIPP